MSEMFTTTGAERVATCETCGAKTTEQELRGIAGSIVWDTGPHNAPCGLPCLGGGVSVKVYRTGAVHKTDSCPRCRKS